jgi:hypothetical protein
MQKRILYFLLFLFNIAFVLNASLVDDAFDMLPKAFKFKKTLNQDNFGPAIASIKEFLETRYGIPSSVAFEKTEVEEEPLVVSEKKKKEPEILVQNQLSISLDDWYKKGTTRSAFVLPYYFENGKKYYFLGCEYEDFKRDNPPTTPRLTWSLFGGKSDVKGMAPLNDAAREFVEESGYLGNACKDHKLTLACKLIINQAMNLIKAGYENDPTEVFAINTNNPKNSKTNYIVFYQFPVEKQKCIDGFNNKDHEMKAFGAIAADDLKRIMLSAFIIEKKMQGAKYQDKRDACCEIPADINVECLVWDKTKQKPNPQYLRSIMLTLKGYLGNDKKGSTFKYFSGGEMVLDSALTQ